MAGPLRVLIVGADPLARSGMMSLLSGRVDLAVVGQVPPEDAAVFLRTEDVDAVVWDVGSEPVPDLDPLHAVAEGQGPPTVVLTAGDGAVPDLIGAGARGVLARTADASRLAAALHAVTEGLFVVDAPLAEAALRTRAAGDALVEPLTPREQEVLQLVGQGLSNRAIAERLQISEHTAKFHVNAILGKLGAQTRAEAVAQGVRTGLLLL